MKQGWYHDSEFGYTHSIILIEENEVFEPLANAYGPFKTFTICKNDAIKYHTTNILTSKLAVQRVKSIKKGVSPCLE